MKREVLFRGKRVDNGEWAIGYYLFAGNDFILPEGMFLNDIVSVDPATICRYTCLIDRNGKRIFEGDILLFKFEQIGLQKAVVEWSEKYAGFKLRPLKDFQYAEILDGEVIGNIYDNPKG